MENEDLMTREELANLVEVFRILKRWRDEALENSNELICLPNDEEIGLKNK
jgi:hypothetical protein